MGLSEPAEPVLTETFRDARGVSFTYRWFCEPPPAGAWFRVTDQAWNESIRDIYHWEKPVLSLGDFSFKVVPWRPDWKGY